MRFFQDYLFEKFSRKVYRVPLDLGLGCPRGGGVDKRCFFCDDDGARASHILPGMDIEEQVQKGIAFVRRRYGNDCGLFAYVQAHTGTNAPLEELRRIYLKLLLMADFDGIIVASRPDALGDDVVDFLSEIAKKIELWIELGVQSANDETLSAVNRGHDFSSVRSAVQRLDSRGINVAAHIILGLPGEGRSEFRKTAKKISALPFKAIKIHNLLILENTVFAEWYRDGKIKTMNEHEYASALIDFIKRLPQDWLLMRICADADEKKVIAPKWAMTKAQFINMIQSMLGDGDESKFREVRTADGSSTLWHPRYKEHYRSLAGARSESRIKFIEACEIRKNLEVKEKIRILEIGLGFGVNLSETLKLLRELGQNSFIEYICLEKDISGLDNAMTLGIIEAQDVVIMRNLLEQKSHEEKGLKILLLEGDGRASVKKLEGAFDAIYLDPFSTEKNLEMWTFDFLRYLAKLMTKTAILATYSSAYPVRGAMKRCGFCVGDSAPFGRRRGGTIVSFADELIKIPLSEKETRIILESTAGIPYRDPNLCDTDEIIRDRRKNLLRKLRSKSVPKWIYAPKAES